MAHLRRGERRGVGMAGIALRGGWNMRAVLALGADAVARGATSGDRWADQRVIELRTGEGCEVLMADIALRRSS